MEEKLSEIKPSIKVSNLVQLLRIFVGFKESLWTPQIGSGPEKKSPKSG